MEVQVIYSNLPRNGEVGAMPENVFSNVHVSNIATGYSAVNSRAHVEPDKAACYMSPMKSIERIRWENLMSLLKDGTSQAELARRMKASPGQVQQWVAHFRSPKPKGTRVIDSSTARRIEAAMDLAQNWMDQDHPASGSVREPQGFYDANRHQSGSNAVEGPAIAGWYPVLGSVPGGEPTEAIEAARLAPETEWHPTSKRCSASSFYLRVTGKSMEPDIADGSLILVDPELAYEHGDIVVVRNGDHEANVKQLSRDGDQWYLVPRNPDYRTRPLDRECRIVGVVREVIKIFR